MADLADVNSDLSQQVVIDTQSMPWQSSPSGTVWRKPLYREGGEFGPVTSLVRYQAGGKFRSHAHPQGEEILVLAGEFCDDHGRYPQGSYLLNPDGSQHAPYSDHGCTLLVRLRQYAGHDRPQIKLDTTQAHWRQGMVEGLTVLPLYAQANYTENMALVHWQPETYFARHTHPGGEEIFVIEGTFEDEHGVYPQGSWIRSPHMSTHTPFSRQGCLIYVRVGGLA
ncbi:MAG: cupin [Gammaproteobacteria bacterium TMED119]|nr:MAG: cupin [Gammaproteobacteria bacterium TMED119]RCL45582.1 MAG: cupin [Candidatus Thioglobus sp.]